MRQLDLEWLNDALPAAITGFSETPLDHLGRQGRLSYLDLEFTSEGDFPNRLVVKRTGEGSVADLSHGLDCFRREVETYRRGDAFMGVPMLACYQADYDPDTGDMLVLLEDISDLFASERQFTFTMTVADAGFRAASYAGLHAKHWLDSSLEDEDWLLDLRPIDNRAFEHFIPDVPGVVQTCLRVLEPVLNPYWTAMLEALLNYDQLKTRFLPDSWTLIHGDGNGGNSVFRDDKLVLMDWNLTGLGDPGMDLAWVLTNETSESIRAIDATIDSYQMAMRRGGVTLSRDDIVSSMQKGAIRNLLAECERSSHVDALSEEAIAEGAQRLDIREQNFRYLGVERLLG